MIGQIPSRVPEILKEQKFKRTVKLKEVLKIQDDGENVIFRNPRYLTLLNDGSLIFFDHPYIYKYDKEGKLIFKILKQGNGPKECNSPNYYFIKDKRIYVYSWIPPKILIYDIDGNYLNEYRIPSSTLLYIRVSDNEIYGVRDEIRYSKFIHMEGVYETPFTLYKITNKFKNLKNIYDIPVEHYIKNARWRRRAMFNIAAYEHYLFILHTSEYQISKFNLRTGRIEKIFKRPYKRIKSQEKETAQNSINRFQNRFLPPPLKYVFDIWWIQMYRNSLWVFTSTKKGKNKLIDVFDLDGNYIDCFYLEYPDNNYYHRSFDTIISDDGFFYVPEENIETGLFSINKYAIED
jgi:hypothetical protein